MTTKSKILCKAFTGYLLKKRFSCYTELGLIEHGRFRADVLALNMQREIIIGEIKVSISDLLKDKKWENYLEFCNKFYFVIPEFFLKEKGYKKFTENHNLDRVGILVLDNKTGFLYCLKKSKFCSMDAHKKLYLLTKIAWAGGISRKNSYRTRQFL